MIYFTKLRWRNLLSTGNVFTEIDLNGAATTLIVGANGGGKSTMIDALCFGLYGKPYRSITKNQLINSLNKSDLLVEVEFITNGKSYLVRRGIKPSVFEVYSDGTMLNKDAADKDYQDYFEKNILRINYKSFSQVVVLGATTFVPFMQMSAAHRRQVIEDLLDLQVFSSMNVLLKDRVATNKNEVNDAKHAISTTEDLLERSKQFANTLEEQSRETESVRERQVARLELERKAAVKVLNDLQAEIEEVESQLIDTASIDATVEKYSKLAAELEATNRTLKRDIKFFTETAECPTCHQTIDDDFRHDMICKRTDKSAKIDEAIEQLGDKLDALKQKASEAKAIASNLQRLRNDFQLRAHELKQIDRQIASLKEERTVDTSLADKRRSLEQEIKNLEAQLAVQRERYRQLHDESQLLSAAASLLKDGGIKSLIIRKYVPVINQLINKYLAALDFFVAFELDENFNETIRSRGRDDFSYASFSEGEKARLDLAIMFAWRALARMRNSMSTNILIFDEVFDGSLDTSGVDDLVKIIHEVAHTENVFVISHRPDAWYDKFERVLRFEKRSNFSQLVPV